jgi:hypothetical protein
MSAWNKEIGPASTGSKSNVIISNKLIILLLRMLEWFKIAVKLVLSKTVAYGARWLAH